MKQIIICIFLITFLISCDYFNNTRICNQTNNDITLKINFDKEVMQSWSGGALAENLSKTFYEWDDNLINLSIDTINYTSIYLINPNTCGQIEGGNNRRPHFHFYKKLEIISQSDTLKLWTKEEMIEAFKADRDIPNRYFDLFVE